MTQKELLIEIAKIIGSLKAVLFFTDNKMCLDKEYLKNISKVLKSDISNLTDIKEHLLKEI